MSEALLNLVTESTKHMDPDERAAGIQQMLDDLGRLAADDGCIAAAWALEALEAQAVRLLHPDLPHRALEWCKANRIDAQRPVSQAHHVDFLMRNLAEAALAGIDLNVALAGRLESDYDPA